MSQTIETRALLAGAYRGYHRQTGEFLTHALNVEAGRFLCRVKADNAADAGATDPSEPPTCATCLKRDPRVAR